MTSNENENSFPSIDGMLDDKDISLPVGILESSSLEQIQLQPIIDVAILPETGVDTTLKTMAHVQEPQHAFKASALEELFSQRLVSAIVPCATPTTVHPRQQLNDEKEQHGNDSENQDDDDDDDFNDKSRYNNETSNREECNNNNNNNTSSNSFSYSITNIDSTPKLLQSQSQPECSQLDISSLEPLQQSNSQQQQPRPQFQLKTEQRQKRRDSLPQTFTEEQRIQERNRKGRERSLRTRRRNALRLKILEENVVYISTENKILKDIVQRLTIATNSTATSLHKAIVMAFKSLLNYASSRPPPYIALSGRTNNEKSKEDIFLADPADMMITSLQINQKTEDDLNPVKDEDALEELPTLETTMETEQKSLHLPVGQNSKQILQPPSPPQNHFNLQLQELDLQTSPSLDFGLPVDELRMALGLNGNGNEMKQLLGDEVDEDQFTGPQ